MRLKVRVTTDEEGESWRVRYADQGQSHLYRRAGVDTCGAGKLEFTITINAISMHIQQPLKPYAHTYTRNKRTE